ncbi:MAG: hypothetical protein RLP44_31505 [Aggregatilineales bacterium]
MAIFREIEPSNISLNNPIARAEHDHIHRKLQHDQRSRWRSIALIAGLIGVVGLLITNRLADMGFFRLLPDAVEVYAVLIATVLMGFWHFGLMLRTLSMSAETFVREKRGGTWESLVLTSAGARRLVLGKWWGVVSIVWKEYVLLAILRAFLIVVIGIVITVRQSVALFPLDADPVSTALPGIVLAWIFSFAFMMINMGFTVAAGVMGSLFGRIHTPSISTGQSARLLVLVIPIVLLLLPVAVLIPLQNEQISYHGLLLLGGAQLSLIDNGMIFMAFLANPYDPHGLIYVVVALITLSVYGLMTILSLRVAERIAIRQGAA